MFWEGSYSLPVLPFVLLTSGHSRHLQWAPDKIMRTITFYQMEEWFCLAHKNCTRKRDKQLLETCICQIFQEKENKIAIGLDSLTPCPYSVPGCPAQGCQRWMPETHSAHTTCAPLPRPPVRHTPWLPADAPHMTWVFISLWVCLKEGLGINLVSFATSFCPWLGKLGCLVYHLCLGNGQSQGA